MLDLGNLMSGDVWACRYHANDRLEPVRIERIGSRRPQRVLVRFLDATAEGREDWVPPARLKVPWDDVDAFVARERRWRAVIDASAVGETDHLAASVVFDKLIDRTIASLGYNATAGVVTIHDVDRLAALLELDPADLQAEPTAFNEDRSLIAPWVTTQGIASRAAQRQADVILRYVEQEEEDACREAIYGRDYPRRRGESWHVEAEICTQTDDEYGKPVRQVLRGWCGTDAAIDETSFGNFEPRCSGLAGSSKHQWPVCGGRAHRRRR